MHRELVRTQRASRLWPIPDKIHFHIVSAANGERLFGKAAGAIPSVLPNVSKYERTAFAINWTHYKLLILIDKEEKRAFYIAEKEKTKEGKDLARMYVSIWY